MERILYATYRITFEKASIKPIIAELKLKNCFIPFLERLKTFSWKLALAEKTRLEKLSIKEAIPNFVIEHLMPVMAFDFLEKNIRYMNQFNNQKSISFRINTLSSGDSLPSLTNSILRELNKINVKIWKDKDIPSIFHTSPRNKSKILRTRSYKNAQIVFQDKASSAIVDLLSPKPREIIFDMCAAPGIKSSIIAQLTNNEAKIICNDFHQTRIEAARNFLTFLKVSNFYLINSDGTKLPFKSRKKFDRILIDAPCTGSGTFLLNPELKWRQNGRFLYQNTLIQEKLIKTALTFIKENGIIVYSTCSLYPEEGEQQIMKFKKFLEPLTIPKWFSPCYRIKNHILKGTGRLFPAIHKTQGFFVGKFKIKGQ
ncbi:MAG: RsmB/NOP family class I SAM-dependent RNA methyltransferase [Candidatus Hodarchaeota archaeon]